MHSPLYSRPVQALLVTFLVILSSLTGCKKASEDPDPAPAVTKETLTGNWQLKTAKVYIKATRSGKVETTDQTRTGTASDFVNFLAPPSKLMLDPADLFGTSTYSWYTSVSGSELTLRKGSSTARNVGYFTVRLSGNTMTWTMNKEQATRSSADSDGFSSVLNGSTDTFDTLQELNLTITFTR
ncbi:hypothetical protein [Fibrella arboris]|uniref:hypothetical protein n=1 Tax=Fibrella arboris TaxID=3242486 RepID=UPI003522DE6C